MVLFAKGTSRRKFYDLELNPKGKASVQLFFRKRDNGLQKDKKVGTFKYMCQTQKEIVVLDFGFLDDYPTNQMLNNITHTSL